MPVPACVTVPVPLIRLLTPSEPPRLKTSAALLVTGPEPNEPFALPSPTWRVPADTVVAPVARLLPARTSVPAPVLRHAALPSTAPVSVNVVPATVSMPPPALLRLRMRALVKLAVLRSTPPCSVIPPALPPRLPSLETASVPSKIRQGVRAVVLPVSVQVLVPVLLNRVKPWYCAAAPMPATSKLLLVAPPSARALPVPLATAFPAMDEPACSSSVLLLPVMRIAFPCTPEPDRPPAITPLLTIPPVSPM